jgi:signal transduction histidine kinase
MTRSQRPDDQPVSPAAPSPFVASAVHELRAPVALQRALAEVALADPDADVTALRDMGSRVVASCERQERLLDALLTLSRSQCGPARREPVDLAAITADVLDSHDCRGLTLSSTFGPAWTIGDSRLVEQLVANLVSNAVRHNVPGGRIELVTATRAGRALLTVVNTGPPIGPEELTRAFRPFERLDADAAPEGLGLGLTVVQAIADAHGALLDASTRQRGGLRVDVDFPACHRHSDRGGDAGRYREPNLWIHHTA